MDGLLFKCLLYQDFPFLPSITERRVLKSLIVILDLALCLYFIFTPNQNIEIVSLVKKAKPNYCLPETHAQYNEKCKLKGKMVEKLCHRNTHQRERYNNISLNFRQENYQRLTETLHNDKRFKSPR